MKRFLILFGLLASCTPKDIPVKTFVGTCTDRVDTLRGTYILTNRQVYNNNEFVGVFGADCTIRVFAK